MAHEAAVVARFLTQYVLAPAHLVYISRRLQAWQRGHHYAPSTIARWVKQLEAWMRDQEQE